MTGRVLPFPPRRASLYEPLDEIRRRTPDNLPDLYESLAREGFVRTWRDDLDDYLGDVRCSLGSHATTAVLAIVAWTAFMVVPFVAGFWS